MTHLLEIDGEQLAKNFAEQPFSVSHHLTGHDLLSVESVALLADQLPESSVEVLNDRAGELLEEVGLGGYANIPAVELPYGRKRALEIATTIALDPEMLLLDEPMAGLGQEDIKRIAALIRTVAQNRTVLMIEHNLSVVADLSNVITVLTRGEILAEGPYSEVSNNAAVREAYMGTGHG